MAEQSALSYLVRRGRRRSLLHLFAGQLALSTAIAFGGCILLILLGTQILNWYWLVALFTISLAYGVWRGQSRIPTAYQVAWSIDGRLHLNDTLSTAFYFGEHPDRTRSPREVIEKQREVAEQMARTVDLHAGIPFAAPRSFTACAVLAMVAIGIFGIRYGITRSLDLRPSLVKIAFDGVMGPSSEIAAAKRKHLQQFADEDAKQLGMAIDPLDAQALDMDPASKTALDTIDTPDVNNPDGGSDPSAKASNQANEDTPQDPSGSTENSDQSSPGNDATSDSNSPDKNGPQAGKPDSKNSNESSNSSSENSSLTEKMRDALANLLSKLKMQPKTGEGKQSASNSQNGPQSGQKQNSKDQNGSPTPGKPQSEGMASPDAQGEQAQNGEQSQSSQGKSNGKSSDRASSQDSKSGIGKEDGDKNIRDAEQLAAMGKISEIIGKRAQNVKGEVMMEVASGKQQLRTQYSQRNATHVEAGGDINRDEIPLAYQQYIQQYFEEIHKLPATKSGKGTQDPKAKTPGS